MSMDNVTEATEPQQPQADMVAAAAPAAAMVDIGRGLKPFGGATEASPYRVYTGPVDYITISAVTAAEALKASGVEAPYRIVRDIPGREVLIDSKKLLG